MQVCTSNPQVVCVPSPLMMVKGSWANSSAGVCVDLYALVSPLLQGSMT